MGTVPRLRVTAMLAMLACAPAVAQPQRRSEAKELYQRATRHYELGDYDRAIDEYKQAYELSAAPALLFNLGQVYRLKKDFAQALRCYTNYLRLLPEASNRADVEAFIVEMRAALEARDRDRDRDKARAVDNAAPPAVPPPPATVTTPPPSGPLQARPAPSSAPSSTRWRAELWAAGSLAVVGLGATVTGLALGARANSDSAAIARASAMSNQTWDATRQALYRDGQRAAAAATALDVIGPLLVAGGALVGVVAWRDHRRAHRLALVTAPGGGGVAWTF